MSDYTPPTLVIPTPGGNPGDGSINGAFTVNDPTTTPPNKPTLKIEGTSYNGGTNTYPTISSPNGDQIDIQGPVIVIGAAILQVGGFRIYNSIIVNYNSVVGSFTVKAPLMLPSPGFPPGVGITRVGGV